MAGTDEGEKHQNSLMNGNRKIGEVAGMVRMSRRHCDIAERYYKLAVVHGFTKGRKVAVCAAC
jgi:transcription initiation factor TFIIIB Brf1 subunit/transcription initiation factor TFIIB